MERDYVTSAKAMEEAMRASLEIYPSQSVFFDRPRNRSVCYRHLSRGRLSYLGLGTQPPLPVGRMLNELKPLWNFPLLAIFPGLPSPSL